MATKLSIMNTTLGFLETGLIADPEDRNESAKVLREHWQSCVEACFEAVDWNFAQIRVALAPLALKPAFGFRAYFQLPDDHMRTVFISATGIENLRRYSEEAGKIACDVDKLYMRYVSTGHLVRIGDWPQTFADYVAWELCSRSTKLNTSGNVKQRISRELPMAKLKAQNYDARANPPIQRKAGRLASAHYGRRGDREQGRY